MKRNPLLFALALLIPSFLASCDDENWGEWKADAQSIFVYSNYNRGSYSLISESIKEERDFKMNSNVLRYRLAGNSIDIYYDVDYSYYEDGKTVSVSNKKREYHKNCSYSITFIDVYVVSNTRLYY